MQKPIKPTKPFKGDNPPKDYKIVEYILAWDHENDCIKLLNEKTTPEYFVDNDGKEVDWFNPEIKDVSSPEEIPFSMLEKVKEILGKNFKVGLRYNEDNYFQYAIIFNREKNENYKKELLSYNERFVRYEVEMSKYRKDLEVYNAFLKEKKKKDLEEKLKKLNEKAS